MSEIMPDIFDDSSKTPSKWPSLETAFSHLDWAKTLDETIAGINASIEKIVPLVNPNNMQELYDYRNNLVYAYEKAQASWNPSDASKVVSAFIENTPNSDGLSRKNLSAIYWEAENDSQSIDEVA